MPPPAPPGIGAGTLDAPRPSRVTPSSSPGAGQLPVKREAHSSDTDWPELEAAAMSYLVMCTLSMMSGEVIATVGIRRNDLDASIDTLLCAARVALDSRAQSAAMPLGWRHVSLLIGGRRFTADDAGRHLFGNAAVVGALLDAGMIRATVVLS